MDKSLHIHHNIPSSGSWQVNLVPASSDITSCKMSVLLWPEVAGEETKLLNTNQHRGSGTKDLTGNVQCNVTPNSVYLLWKRCSGCGGRRPGWELNTNTHTKLIFNKRLLSSIVPNWYTGLGLTTVPLCERESVFVVTYSHSLHLIQSLWSLCFGKRATISQSFENTVEGQQVGLNFLLTHLFQQILQTEKETQLEFLNDLTVK